VRLFVYGTLLFPEVLTALLGRVPPSAPAVAPGWRVAALAGRVYPGLAPDPASAATGAVLSGLDATELVLLDAYEDVDEADYARTDITLADGTACPTYVWLGAVLPTTWTPDAFAAAHLGEYVLGCHAWRAGYPPRRSG
jgi:gamma-glutamylcyclotransferase (GGCT)/AIG2-like uncharacterized protein YtfP